MNQSATDNFFKDPSKEESWRSMESAGGVDMGAEVAGLNQAIKGVEAQDPFFSGIAAGLEDGDSKEGRAIRDAVMGKVRDDDPDPLLAMEGIINGDPVGMETFDLGFFDDGTPAIRIGKGAIPVNQSMWMALVKMRADTRMEMDARMEHARKVDESRKALSTALRAMPKIPNETRAVLEALLPMYPEFVAEQIGRMSVNMEGDGGITQQIELGAEYQNYKGRTWTQGKTSQRQQFVPLEKRIEKGMSPDQQYEMLPSKLDEAKIAARNARDLEMANALDTAAFVAQVGAASRIERARKGMMTAGLFDVCYDFDNNRQAPQSMLGQLMLAASNNEFNDGDGVPIPARINNITEAQAYLEQLQSWGNRHWGYSDNAPDSVLSAAHYVMWFVNNRNQQQPMQPMQPTQPAAQPPSGAQPTAPSPSGTAAPARRSGQPT